jgi:adenylylsulfate kinase-like enzyme
MKAKSSIVWIMGLSGSGKTTTARYVVEKLREANENVVHLDGDELRDALNQRANYDQTYCAAGSHSRDFVYWFVRGGATVVKGKH